MKNIRDEIAVAPLLFDGGMGTYFSELNRSPGNGCELANLSQPKLIDSIHREYLTAGARAVKTNTFAVNRISFQGDEELATRVIHSGFSLAAEAAHSFGAWVFADIGPVFAEKNEQIEAEYRWLAERFIEEGATCFLFETNAVTTGLCQTAAYIKSCNPDAFIITSFAVQPDGFSREGIYVEDLLQEMSACTLVDAVGLNCICGARHMLELVQTLDHSEMNLALMPNAGYPMVRANRTYYEGDPAYFAEQLLEMASEGAVILGGCCGTTPIHIERARAALSRFGNRKVFLLKAEHSSIQMSAPESPFWEKLTRGEKEIAVELDSPENADVTNFLTGARDLQIAGADILTIADCPVARARMDSSLLACRVKRELGLETLPHMACRDRNQNATKALLLGIYAENIRNVLVVTGDPVPTAERDEVKSVYQFNSLKLAAYISALNKQVLPAPFHIFGGLNLNAVNFDAELHRAQQKLSLGMSGFLTQPVLSHRAFENLQQAREDLRGAYLLGGIIPVVSDRNARYMDSEINGISVDPAIAAQYEGKNREEAEDLAVEISVEIARQIEPLIDSFYLITPFRRTGLICRIIEAIHRAGLV